MDIKLLIHPCLHKEMDINQKSSGFSEVFFIPIVFDFINYFVGTRTLWIKNHRYN